MNKPEDVKATINSIIVKPGQLWQEDYYSKIFETGEYYKMKFNKLMVVTKITNTAIEFMEVIPTNTNDIGYTMVRYCSIFAHGFPNVVDDKEIKSNYGGTITKYSLVKKFKKKEFAKLLDEFNSTK